jgi:hypothetical protein
MSDNKRDYLNIIETNSWPVYLRGNPELFTWRLLVLFLTSRIYTPDKSTTDIMKKAAEKTNKDKRCWLHEPGWWRGRREPRNN